jgi:hypothetical protein
MKTRLFLTAAALLFAMVFSGGAGIAATDVQGFFSGAYAGSGQGYLWFTPSGGQATKLDVSQTVRIVFNGDIFFGTDTTVSTEASFAGSNTVCTDLISGSYVLNYDGTGTLKFSTTNLTGGCPDSSGSQSFVTTGAGNVIHLIADSYSVDPSAGTANSIVFNSNISKQN